MLARSSGSHGRGAAHCKPEPVLAYGFATGETPKRHHPRGENKKAGKQRRWFPEPETTKDFFQDCLVSWSSKGITNQPGLAKTKLLALIV